VIVLDDGFQHRAIARAFDIVLMDGRGGPLLPAGPLREPLVALQRADALVLVDRDEVAPLDPPASFDRPRFRMRLEAAGLVESVERRWIERSLGELAGRRVVAVTGIARPNAFYALLRRWDVVIDEVFEYPDHHRYTAEDWQQIARGGHGADLIVTTEKDLVKLEAFPFATGKLVALRIAPQVENAEQLLAAILAAIGAGARSEPAR
jgi:tetraacyldisaccharide 4'-kinase